MKKIFTLLAFIFVMQVAHSENYFRVGSVWEGCYAPQGEAQTAEKWEARLYTPYEINGETVAPFVYEFDKYERYAFLVKTDGDKVLWKPFKVTDEALSQWYLLYDFGLQPGDVAELYPVPETTDGVISEVTSVNVVCQATNITLEGRFGRFMEMAVADSDDSKKGYWAIGVGNIFNLDNPADFNDPGEGYGLSKATVKDGWQNIIVFGYGDAFSETANYYKPGTVWYQSTLTVGISTPPEKVLYTYYKLLDPIEFKGYEAMPYVQFDPTSGKTGEPEVYFRTDGNKVYWCANEVEDPADDNWYLIYDFGLLPGERVEVCQPIISGGRLRRVDMELIECMAVNMGIEGEIGSFMEVAHIYDESSSTNTRGLWGMGIGSLGDPLIPVSFALDGIYSSILSVTTAEGEVVYDRMASVSESHADDVKIAVNGRTLELTGLSTDTHVSVYDLSGALVAEGYGTCSFSLTGKSVYIVKAGTATRKVVL